MNIDISILKGIGKKSLIYLNEKGIYTIKDFLLNLPIKYVVYEKENLSNILENKLLCLSGNITSGIITRKFKNSVNSLIFSINVSGILVKVLVFGQDFWRFRLKKGQNITIYGNYKYKEREIIAKEINLENSSSKIETYYDIDMPNKTIKKIISDIYLQYELKFDDKIPNFLVEKYRLLEYNDYLKISHFPTTKFDIKQIFRRKKYSKYLESSISFECLRYYYDSVKKEPKKYDETKISKLINDLPYKLTSDQQIAINTMLEETRSNQIMNRLVQGDVGSGKSIVSLLIALANVSASYQVVLMAPTEILAIQHYNYFCKLLNDYKIRIALLTGSTKNKDRLEILEHTMNKRIDILIGTHALIEDTVKFKNLGLVIIDEQHRFGVRERSKLLDKGECVDAMFLTATPIPRTLGITRFGDLDITSIKTKPLGRKEVITKAMKMTDLDFLVEEIKRNISNGNQVFVIVPLVNESEKIEAISINECYDLLNMRLPKIEISTIHGNLKSQEKDKIMNQFKNHEIDVLISTTVIEVGVDIKNATLMVIFNAERFGLSQLHQLRGRVGRNDLESYCYLVSNNDDCQRLNVLESCNDCFTLSDEDLKLRGPGDFLGEKQSGFLELELENDIRIYECARNDAKEIYHKHINNIEKFPIIEDILDTFNSEKIKLN